METGILAKLSAWFWTIVPAAIGSALSLYLGKEKTALMTKLELLLVFLFGISIAHFLGGAAIAYLAVTVSIISDAIKFTVGLVGMAILSHVLEQSPLVVTALRKKYFPGGD
jgi:K+-sensing histidine kinase KdpD